MAELKPCPFCGGAAMRMNCDGKGQPIAKWLEIHYVVRCLKCGIRTNTYQTKKGAINAWNRRVDNG